MSLKIENHLLVGDRVKHCLVRGKENGVFTHLDTLMMHYTASSNLTSALNTLTNPKNESCAHLILDDDGTFYQLKPFNKITWHAGESKWRDRVGLNRFSIGIEIRNAGYLTKSGNIYRTTYSQIVPKENVIYAQHRNEKISRYWEVYTEEQLSRVREASELLIDTYGLKFILGHEEVSPTRRVDPGPAFPLDKFRNELLGNNRRDDITTPLQGITSATVNIRTTSTSLSPIVCTLDRNSKVPIIGESNGFYEVVIKGYIKKEFVDAL